MMMYSSDVLHEENPSPSPFVHVINCKGEPGNVNEAIYNMSDCHDSASILLTRTDPTYFGVFVAVFVAVATVRPSLTSCYMTST